MTLSIALISPRETVFVTDRRFSDEIGRTCTEEGSKLTLFLCLDARAAVGYTGLAKAGVFSTHQWLLQSLCDAAPPDLHLRSTVERLAQIATRDIAKLNLPKTSCRLSITICGYYYGELPPLAFLCRVSNFENDDGSADASARDYFSVTCLRQKREPGDRLAKVFMSGFTRAVRRQDHLALEQLLAEEKPRDALLAKAVQVIRSAARSDRSRGLIGEQCLSAVIPCDRTRKILTGYHSSKVTYEMFMPSIVNATSPQTLGYIMDPCLTALQGQGNAPALVVPKVGRNHPCPCGSGKKYKHCHGRVDRLHFRVD